MSTTHDLDRLIRDFTDGGLPGCGLMITQNGKTLYEGYSGYADLDAKTPITEKSVYRMASMSKIPLYVTMMMLYEQGKFLMTDPITNYFPEWANMKKVVHQANGYFRIEPVEKPITIRDVMSMKCGLPYCNSDAPTDNRTLRSMQEAMKPLWERGYYTNREQIEAISKSYLACEPGTEWIYGFSSELAAGIIEAVCDKPVNDVFREFLFDPLGMDDTRAIFFGDIEERMVKLYAKKADGTMVPGPTFFDKKHLPGKENEAGWARLFSTVPDFTKLMTMLACGGVYEGQRIMGRKTIDAMRANGLDKLFTDTYNAGYGYGYGVRTLMDKAAGNHNGSLGAFGWTGGFGTWCEADPEDQVAIVYMHNMMPNMEAYYHLRMRNVAYGLID
ncbi:MAG: serine hydrolase [Ruminococcaceae bacterium]|nr:serine hydrolase [Oscillospiraceae bacterium]